MREDEWGEGGGEKAAETGMESRGREWGAQEEEDSKKRFFWSLWGGGDHPNRSITISSPSPVGKIGFACNKGGVYPQRGHRKTLRSHSSSLCEGPTAACRHLASHWSLISRHGGGALLSFHPFLLTSFCIFIKKIYSFAFYQILFRSKKVECGNSLSVFWPKKDKLLKIAGLCCV